MVDMVTWVAVFLIMATVTEIYADASDLGKIQDTIKLHNY